MGGASAEENKTLFSFPLHSVCTIFAK